MVDQWSSEGHEHTTAAAHAGRRQNDTGNGRGIGRQANEECAGEANATRMKDGG